jgi:hypothetical protein
VVHSKCEAQHHQREGRRRRRRRRTGLVEWLSGNSTCLANMRPGTTKKKKNKEEEKQS